MGFGDKMMRAYFNHVYNPMYDFTTARLNRYRELQKTCVAHLALDDNDRVLCVGVGSGNEVAHIIKANQGLEIVGVDYSTTALRSAHRKALRLDREIEVLHMDARRLLLPSGSFDRVLCIHVMDFVGEATQVTQEILRVLRDGGRYVITYPSEREGTTLGLNLLKYEVSNSLNSGKNRAIALLGLAAQLVIGVIYLPLLCRRGRRSYTRDELSSVMAQLTDGGFQIEEDHLYQDWIVYGTKLAQGGGPNAY
jgi:ubiquinone/menaquinone biosynthesis C-methylase UbiE